MSIAAVTSLFAPAGRNYVLVKVVTSDGLVGYGDATLNGRELAVVTVIDEYLRGLLVGEDEANIEYLWRKIYQGTYWQGGPVLMTALAGVDMALWDIKGKRAGLPLWSLLGGRARERALAYVHVHGRDRDELIARSREKLASGFRAIRFSFDSVDPRYPELVYTQAHQDVSAGWIERADGDPPGAWDSRTYVSELPGIAHAMREALGSSVGLIHDVHSRITASESVRVAKELEPAGLFFLEDPAPHHDLDALATIRSQSTTPVAVGELYFELDGVCELVRRRLVDFVRVDISHFGGITPMVKLAHLAEAFHVQTAFHGPGDISPPAHAVLAHLALTVANFGIQEMVEDRAAWSGVFSTSVTVEDGFITVGDTPGLGVDVDEAAVRGAHYVKASLPTLRDAMGAVHPW